MRSALLLILLFVPVAVHADAPPKLYACEITAVLDGNTIEVIWREEVKADVYPKTPAVKLVGIWSDSQREPPATYAKRLEFLNSLKGRLVKLQVNVDINASSRTTDYYTISAYPETPTEILFEDGSSLNDLIIRNGLALLDESPGSGLEPSEFERYSAAQSEAIAHHLGIWAGDTRPYLEVQGRLRQERLLNEKQKGGLKPFLLMQALLALCVFWFAWLVRKNSNGLKAALWLLTLPVCFGLVVISIDKAATASVTRHLPKIAGQSVISMLVWIAVTGAVFTNLVMKGPSELWGALWIGVRRPAYLFSFFAGLWILIFLSAASLMLGGAGSWMSALSYASAIALGLSPTVVPQSAWRGFTPGRIALVERVLFILWLGISAARIAPRNILLIKPGTRPWNIAVAVASMLIVVLSVVTVFSLLYFLGLLHVGLVETSTRSDTIWYSLAILFRQSSSAMPVHTAWINLLQVIEAHIGLFLSLVGFRVIYVLTTREVSGAPEAVGRT